MEIFGTNQRQMIEGRSVCGMNFLVLVHLTDFGMQWFKGRVGSLR